MIIAFVTYATCFGSSHSLNHIAYLIGSLGLLPHETMVKALATLERPEKLWCNAERNAAHRATAIADVKIARSIQWMWFVVTHVEPQFTRGGPRVR